MFQGSRAKLRAIIRNPSSVPRGGKIGERREEEQRSRRKATIGLKLKGGRKEGRKAKKEGRGPYRGLTCDELSEGGQVVDGRVRIVTRVTS